MIHDIRAEKKVNFQVLLLLPFLRRLGLLIPLFLLRPQLLLRLLLGLLHSFSLNSSALLLLSSLILWSFFLISILFSCSLWKSLTSRSFFFNIHFTYKHNLISSGSSFFSFSSLSFCDTNEKNGTTGIFGDSIESRLSSKDGNKDHKDALEGDTIRLACRYNPEIISSSGSSGKEPAFYWQKTSVVKGQDVVAINGNSLSKDYALDVSEGKYDLVIPSAQYDRDNGQFECKIKEPGSGIEIHSKAYVVTILSKSLKETKLFVSFSSLLFSPSSLSSLPSFQLYIL